MHFRQSLFQPTIISPVQQVYSATRFEFAPLTSPDVKVNDEKDSSTQKDCSIKLPGFDLKQRFKGPRARKSLFTGKRLADDDLCDISPVTKVAKDERIRVRTDLKSGTKDASENIIEVIERLEINDLIADGSRDYALPTVLGKHGDLKSIDSNTMANVLQGKYMNKISEVTIIDCRYPYEFEGGHIRGAVNLYTKDLVYQFLQKRSTTSGKRNVLIFHCEFSSERGPKMYRFLRSQDRNLNKDSYPNLNFPEVYLLEGGYKSFYASYKEFCDPINYKPMLHKDHSAELRHFRVKSKSWTSGERQAKCRRHSNRSIRQSFEF